MQNISVPLSEPKSDAEYQAAVKQMLTEIESLNQQMSSDRKEIDRLKMETRAILASLGVAL